MDTSPFIYHLETHPLYGPVAATLFAWLERRGSSGVTSTITMTELLVHPYRKDDLDRVNTIYALTSTYPHLAWLPPTLGLADQAARVRAKYGLRTPDAIQIASAISARATGFVGNDDAFTRVTEIEVLLFDDVVDRPSPARPMQEGPEEDGPAT